MLITADHWTFSPLNFCAYIYELSMEIQILVLSFLALNAHHFLNSVFNVEDSIVFSELVAFDLGKIQQILNDKAHKLS